MALQQDNALQSQPEYVTFALFFIVFGLAVIAAVLMLLKFMTINTDDENRDEIEVIEVGIAGLKSQTNNLFTGC